MVERRASSPIHRAGRLALHQRTNRACAWVRETAWKFQVVTFQILTFQILMSATVWVSAVRTTAYRSATASVTAVVSMGSPISVCAPP